MQDAISNARKGVRELYDDIRGIVVPTLEEHVGVTRVQYYERPGAQPADIARWEKHHAPYVLPDDLKAFLCLSDGLLLRWHVEFRGEIVPLGCMQLNPLAQLTPIAVENWSTQSVDDWEKEEEGGEDNSVPACFDLDNTCRDGRLALCFVNGPRQPQVWFQSNGTQWNFISSSFVDYFRLMIMHRGLPHWHYAFSAVGLDPTSLAWMRFMAPERLSVNLLARPAQNGAIKTIIPDKQQSFSAEGSEPESTTGATASSAGAPKLNLSKLAKATKHLYSKKDSNSSSASNHHSHSHSHGHGHGEHRPESAAGGTRGKAGSRSGGGVAKRPASALAERRHSIGSARGRKES